MRAHAALPATAAPATTATAAPALSRTARPVAAGRATIRRVNVAADAVPGRAVPWVQPRRAVPDSGRRAPYKRGGRGSRVRVRLPRVALHGSGGRSCLVVLRLLRRRLLVLRRLLRRYASLLLLLQGRQCGG